MVNVIDQVIENDFALYHADTVEVARGIPDNSIGFSDLLPAEAGGAERAV